MRGPWPKVIGFGLLGFIVGRLSYLYKYDETMDKKLKKLPNSKLAEIRRRRKLGLDINQIGTETTQSLTTHQSTTDIDSDGYIIVSIYTQFHQS